MRAMSSAVSITFHVALGAAVLFGTARTGSSHATRSTEVVMVFPQTSRTDREVGVGVPTIENPAMPDVPVIPLPSALLQTGAPSHPAFPTYVPSTVTPGGVQPSAGWGGVLGEEHPEVLTGPLPAYPDLLRQAGIQGEVVLEALIDTTGRVQAASILVVSATNPGFVEPARQALRATQ